MQEPQETTQDQVAEDAAREPGRSDVEQAQELPPANPARSRGRAFGLAAVAGAVVVGVLAVGFALGSGSAGDDGSSARVTERGQIPAAEAVWTAPDGRTTVGADQADGRGRRGAAAFDRSAITITGIEGTRLSLETTNGWTRTIDAAGATVTKDGETVGLADLGVGDRIAFRETRNDDGTYTITAIAVIQPIVAGTVDSVGGSTVTITTFDGSTQKVLLTSATTYAVGRAEGTRDAVVADVRIVARGSLGADGSLTATMVVVEPATARGTVAEKSASSITITTRDGSTVVVKVTADTTYRVAGVDSATLADVAVGAVVMAAGTESADGSLTATTVVARPAGDLGGPGWGGGHGGGRFPGGGTPGDGGFPGGGFPGWGPGADPDAAPTPDGTGTSG